MNAFDIIVLVLVIASFAMGMMKGLVKELAGLLGIVAGAYCAKHFSNIVAGWLSSYIEDANVTRVVAFAITLVAVIIGVHFLAILINRLVGITALGTVNRLCGGAFSAIKTLFILSCLLYVFNRFGIIDALFGQDMIDNSRSYDFVSGFAKFVFPYIDEATQQINGGLSTLNP